IGLELPGMRAYHLVDFFLTFRAPGAPFLTFRAFTNRAPGMPLSHGLPSGASQVSYSQYWMTVTLNRLLAIAPSLFVVAGRAGQAQPQVGAQLGGGWKGQRPLRAQEPGQLGRVNAGRLGQPVQTHPAAGDRPPQLFRQVRGFLPLRHAKV